MKTLKRFFVILLFFGLIISLFKLAYSVQKRQNKSYEIYSDKNDPKKYVVYECTNEGLCGGWADRLKVYFCF